MWNRSKVTYTLYILLLLACFSCKTKQKVVDNPSVRSEAFQSLSTKSTAALYQGEKQLFTSAASLRLKRDSLIVLSIQPIAGVEVVRLTFEPNQICVINRIHKQYVKSTYEQISPSMKSGDFFHALQSILCAELFLVESNRNAIEKDFTVATIESNQFLQHTYHSIMQEFTLDSNRQISWGSLFDESIRLKWSYSQYETLANGTILPMKTYLSIQTTPQNRMDLDISHKKVDIDMTNSFSNSIPNNYEEVTWEKLMSSFNK